MLPIPFNRDWFYRESSGNMMFDPRAAQAVRIPVTLPHDATIHEKRTPDAASGTAKGYYPNKDYEYTRTIDVPAEWAEKRVYLRFEGAYMNARVFVNGEFAGQGVNGYGEFAVLLSDFLRCGEKNEIKVTVQSDEDSRWYAGAGLYREAALFVADPLHIALNGVRLTTLAADETVASVAAEIDVANEGVRARKLSVEIALTDAEGNVACRDAQALNLRGLTAETVHQLPRCMLICRLMSSAG